jgi:hypothetical protein
VKKGEGPRSAEIRERLNHREIRENREIREVLGRCEIV